MGCGGSKEDAASGTPAASGSADPKKAAESAGQQKFVELIFNTTGKTRMLVKDEKLMTQNTESESAYYIKSGTVNLLLTQEDGTTQQIATRGAGEVIGELSLLLGQPTSVNAVAADAVTVIEVQHTQLMTLLRDDPMQSGRLFKVIATYLSERISELSSKMRANVTSQSASQQQAASQAVPSADVAKARQMFQRPKDEKLLGIYQCSVRRELNAVKEARAQFGAIPAQFRRKSAAAARTSAPRSDRPPLSPQANAHFGELYLFESHLCFDLKVFAFHKQWVLEMKEVVAFLRSESQEKTVDVEGKGYSYELHIPDDNFDEAIMVMEALRLQAKTAGIAADSQKMEHGTKASDFKEMKDAIIKTDHHDKKTKHRALDMDLKEEDWRHFMAGAKQRTYRKGEYVLKEGMPTAALFQIVRGTLRVELQLKDQPNAVVVGYRKPGEMFGETSLLKEGVATASIAAHENAEVVCIEGAFLEQLFSSHPGLPGRFFCFLAAYQAERLYKLTQTAAESKQPTVTASTGLRLKCDEVMGNQAYAGLFRKFLVTQEDTSPELLQSFDFYTACEEYKYLPDLDAIKTEAKRLATKYITERSSQSLLGYLDNNVIDNVNERLERMLDADSHASDSPSQKRELRKIFLPIQTRVLTKLDTAAFEKFLGSMQFKYILELKAKENIKPTLSDFKVVRVLGEGGFGQVIEVVKRDCGVRYAMKVMQKEAMKHNLGSVRTRDAPRTWRTADGPHPRIPLLAPPLTPLPLLPPQAWRKKIAMEQQLLSLLNHAFMVNLYYAFQNPEFLILVMDLVPSGDLSEFVLTKKRLTPEQVRWAIMEVVEVMGYIHGCRIMYRDLKPENLLVDEVGHVRLIDMGLAARYGDKNPTRTSRVGTDCYMAPEVRWCRRKREPYGVSCDWYTVGVLLYEFSNGALPFTQRDQEKPTYREGQWTSPQNKSLCESLLEQDWTKRIGSKNGAAEIKDHPFFKKVDWEMFPVGNGFRAIDQDKSEKDQAKGTLPEIDWDIVSQCKIPSPMKGVKGVPKKKKDKEVQAQRTAGHIAEAEKAAADADAQVVAEYDVTTWDYVSSKAITEEYMQSMFQCVSSI